MPKRKAHGEGSIRQRADGRWECRVTVGRDPGTGKQVRKSFYAPTQKELVALMKQVQADLENGAFVEPSKLTVSAWMDIWTAEYLGGVKESTQASYKGHAKNHIKPNLGAVLLQKLTPHVIQKFYNDLTKAGKSAKTVRNIHGVLHGAMEQARKLGYIRVNPTEACTLPRAVKPDVKVMNDDIVSAFLTIIQGHRFEAIFFVDLFSGMRQAEILGLSWENVNFEKGTIFIDRQLVRSKLDGRYYIDTAKHDKARTINPAPVVMQKLKQRKAQQTADQLRSGAAWENEWGLVFTNEVGKHLAHNTLRQNFKRIVADLGAPDLTFHGLRHSYAVISLMSGDDVKTVQENLGHHTAAFTLETYAHATDRMKEESANRMERYIINIQKHRSETMRTVRAKYKECGSYILSGPGSIAYINYEAENEDDAILLVDTYEKGLQKETDRLTSVRRSGTKITIEFQQSHSNRIKALLGEGRDLVIENWPL